MDGVGLQVEQRQHQEAEGGSTGSAARPEPHPAGARREKRAAEDGPGRDWRPTGRRPAHPRRPGPVPQNSRFSCGKRSPRAIRAGVAGAARPRFPRRTWIPAPALPPRPALTQSALATSSISEPAQSCTWRDRESHLQKQALRWAIGSGGPDSHPTARTNSLTFPSRPARRPAQPPPPSPSPAAPERAGVRTQGEGRPPGANRLRSGGGGEGLQCHGG